MMDRQVCSTGFVGVADNVGPKFVAKTKDPKPKNQKHVVHVGRILFCHVPMPRYRDTARHTRGIPRATGVHVHRVLAPRCGGRPR